MSSSRAAVAGHVGRVPVRFGARSVDVWIRHCDVGNMRRIIGIYSK